jgi:hypothetical protein
VKDDYSSKQKKLWEQVTEKVLTRHRVENVDEVMSHLHIDAIDQR